MDSVSRFWRFMIPRGKRIVFRSNICGSIRSMDKGASGVESQLKYWQEMVYRKTTKHLCISTLISDSHPGSPSISFSWS